MLSTPIRASLFILILLIFSTWAQAGEPSPVGRWRQIDDEDGLPRSILRIDERQGEFGAIVERIFTRPGEDTDPVCTLCTDTRKGQKIIGMKILSGLRRDGDRYSGGQILDPDNGKTYQARMTLSADGKTLEVRGFIGLSLFGRSQTWFREGTP